MVQKTLLLLILFFFANKLLVLINLTFCLYIEGQQVDSNVASVLFLWLLNHRANKRSEEHHQFGLNTSIIETFFFFNVLHNNSGEVLYLPAWNFLSFWECFFVLETYNPLEQVQSLQRCNCYSSNKIIRTIGSIELFKLILACF